jgi:sulfide dehydrogenase cytochrome subunit
MHHRNLISVLLAGLLAGGTSAMAQGPTAGAVLGHTCSGCHGTNGASVGPAPVIGGLSEMYLASAMAAYKDGTRYSTVMGRLAKGYDQGEILDMSKFLAAQPWVSGKLPVDAKLAERGQQVHNANGCAGCHGANGISPMPATPRMAGQYADYLVFQMRDYKDANKAIPPGAMVMRNMLAAVSDDDVKALAAFYASAK